MSLPRLLIAVLALAITLPTAVAESRGIDDLRVFFSPWMGTEASTEGRLDDEAPDVGYSDHRTVGIGRDLRSHQRGGIAWYRSTDELRPGIGSLVMGVEIALDQVEQEQSVFTLEGDTWLVDVFLGWGWALTPSWHIEQGIIGGVGESRWRWHGEDTMLAVGGEIADEDATSRSFAYEYGFRLGTYWTLAQGWQAGVDVRYLLMRSEAVFRSTSTSSGNNEIITFRPDIEISGLGAMISLGYRF